MVVVARVVVGGRVVVVVDTTAVVLVETRVVGGGVRAVVGRVVSGVVVLIAGRAALVGGRGGPATAGAATGLTGVSTGAASERAVPDDPDDAADPDELADGGAVNSSEGSPSEGSSAGAVVADAPPAGGTMRGAMLADGTMIGATVPPTMGMVVEPTPWTVLAETIDGTRPRMRTAPATVARLIEAGRRTPMDLATLRQADDGTTPV